MPTKDIQDLPEMCMLHEGKNVKIGKVLEAQIISDDCIDDLAEDPLILNVQNTVTFETMWSPTIDAVYLLIYGRLPSNNGRKMHGYPLRRKRCR